MPNNRALDDHSHPAAAVRGGRPRSERAHQAILTAARALLIEEGFASLRLEHVAARAGVGKATIYRRWASKEALAQDLLTQLAGPHIEVADSGSTRDELLAAVTNPMRAVIETDFGPVIKAMLSQIASNPRVGDPFRASIVEARRGEITKVIQRGIARGDLRPDADPGVATELLVGPVYFRLMFGGVLDLDFADQVVDSVLRGFSA
ncbi:MAG TPA: TetR/AcrR family transcriptional regulator [Candidatus Acidoferrales bacterium]|nr:TetR/AcrR family transcriptional regulator [Candidatus Acidoferrales bacterium]